MAMNRRHVDELTGAIFLIGLGCLFYFGFWPGILFLLGGISLIRGLYRPRAFGEIESAAFLFGFGTWALMGYSIGALFILAGISMLGSMLLRNTVGYPSSWGTAKPAPKPNDSYLD